MSNMLPCAFAACQVFAYGSFFVDTRRALINDVSMPNTEPYALDGERECLHVDRDDATLLVSLLVDLPSYDTLINVDAYVSRAHDSGNLTLVDAVRADLGEYDELLPDAELPALANWVENDLTLRAVCDDLVSQ